MENSKIQWTGNTWNPWHGCKKVSEGCKYCYMFRDKERFKQDPTTVIRSKKFNDPLKWIESGLVFTCSWSDWFIEEADAWRNEAWDIIKKTPHLTYQILTKRPERIKQCLPDDWGDGYENVWLGVSIENQVQIKRFQILDEVPAKIKFLSIEPLLGRLDFMVHIPGVNLNVNLLVNRVDWVILGGESGNESGKYRYRPCELNWLLRLIDQCKEAGVPVFTKQLGTYLSKSLGLKDRHGGDINEWPSKLRIREFPNK